MASWTWMSVMGLIEGGMLHGPGDAATLKSWEWTGGKFKCNSYYNSIHQQNAKINVDRHDFSQVAKLYVDASE